MQLIVQKKGWKFERLDDDKQRLSKLQDDWYVIDIHHSDPRTDAQNRYYWVMLTIISHDTGHTTDELHDVFKMMFLGLDYNWNITTTTKTIESFTNYVEKIKQRCAKNNYIIPIDS